MNVVLCDFNTREFLESFVRETSLGVIGIIVFFKTFVIIVILENPMNLYLIIWWCVKYDSFTENFQQLMMMNEYL